MSDRRYLPLEWGNEERLRVLLGPMPNEAVARTGRITFWSQAVHAWCRHEQRLVFTLQDALSAFRHGTQQPQCMADVLLAMGR